MTIWKFKIACLAHIVFLSYSKHCSSCSGQKSWSYPFLLLSSCTPYPVSATFKIYQKSDQFSPPVPPLSLASSNSLWLVSRLLHPNLNAVAKVILWKPSDHVSCLSSPQNPPKSSLIQSQVLKQLMPTYPLDFISTMSLCWAEHISHFGS